MTSFAAFLFRGCLKIKSDSLLVFSRIH
ncbi:hypothetical protein D046_4005A, partial [Vibrio parahaemolyticus V-223/04]